MPDAFSDQGDRAGRRPSADQAVIAIENVRLFNETREALERQTATAEILRVISGSPTDVTPVFDAIAERARVLCGASLGYTTRFDGERLHLVGYHGVSPEAEAVMRAMFPRKPDRGSINGRCLMARAPVWISDVELDPEYQLAAQAKAADFRSMLAVPMLQGGRPIGVVGVARKDPGPFADELLRLLQTFADQAAIAIENVRLFNETKEALEHQTATADILRVISESPTDVQPVFDVIAERAVRLTGASLGFVFRFDGDLIHIASVHGVNPEGLAAARNAFPMQPGDGSATARAVRDGVVVNIGNVYSDTEVGYKTLEVARLAGYRAVLAVPMLREREIVGAIAVTRVEAGQFAEREVDLLRTFADQAVIAIENVRLFNETKEGLRQQTAVAGVLKVISQSTFDLERVLTTLIENATQLCEASHGFVFRPHGDVFRLAVSHGAAPAFVEHIAAIPVRPERGYLIGRVVLDRKPVQILDALEDPDYRQAQSQRLGGYRTMLGVPMLSGSTVVGVIVVWRQEVRAFTDKQIELLTTFADQAAIAIENVRLFNETKEALERQTATAEVLKVISASPTDVQPVLNAVAERAGLLCKAEGSRVWLLAPGDKLRVAANHGPDLAGEDELPLRRTSVGGRAFLERRLLHVEDIVPLIDTEYPDVRDLQARHGFRTVLVVPMLRDGQPIGVISLLRRWVQPFAEADINLVRTFADQAVIAIENTRLFNETREALEQQTATSEILRVISRSPIDTKPVFEAIVDACLKLFPGHQIGINLQDAAGGLYLSASRLPNAEALRRFFEEAPMRRGGSRMKLRRSVAHYPDIEAEGVPEEVRDGCRISGAHSIVYAPLVLEEKGIGSLWVARTQAGPFADKQIALLKTFADQAVIAIQNVRRSDGTRKGSQPRARRFRATGRRLGHRPSRARRRGRERRHVFTDTAEATSPSKLARRAGYRSVLFVPLLRERAIVCAIAYATTGSHSTSTRLRWHGPSPTRR